MGRSMRRGVGALSHLVFSRRQRHTGHRFDPDEMIVHLVGAGDVLGRDDESLTFPVVRNDTPQLDDAVLDNDVGSGCPALIAECG